MLQYGCPLLHFIVFSGHLATKIGKVRVKKLVYLHIPKTAGTSQRSVYFDLYGPNSVFWHGQTVKNLDAVFDAATFEKYRVLFGHKPISFYPIEMDALYCSVVRDPVMRVVSFFMHCAKPHLVEDGLTNSRKSVHQYWLDRGLEPDSIVNTINNCVDFRNSVENFQCRYLSRNDRTFSGAMKNFRDDDFIVGSSEDVVQMNKYLSELLCWGEVPEKKKNRSLSGAHHDVLSEAGARQLIESLNGEDIKLNDFITKECGGLYVGVRDSKSVSSSLAAEYTFSGGVTAASFRQVKLYAKGCMTLSSEGLGTTGVCIVNGSETELGAGEPHDIVVYFDCYGREQRYLGRCKDTI